MPSLANARKIKRVFIFVPGYYGTSLIEPRSGRLIWGDPKEILLNRKSLNLPIEGVKVAGIVDLEPYQVINSISLMGGLLRKEGYQKTTEFMRSFSPEAIIPVPWDWRRDPIFAVQGLDEAVKKAQLRFPSARLSLISHSFGSLIASYYLRYGTQNSLTAEENWYGLSKFSHVVLAAAPFRGLMEMFRNMQMGIRFGLNSAIRTRMSFCSFESSYFLLPAPGTDQVHSDNGQLVSLNLSDPGEWEKNHWGLFNEKLRLSDSSLSTRQLFTTNQIQRSKRFRNLLLEDKTNRPEKFSKVLYLEGTGFKTIQHGVWLKDKSPHHFLFNSRDIKNHRLDTPIDPIYGDGDQTVTSLSSKLPQALKPFTAINHISKNSHLEVLQNLESQRLTYNFLNS